MEALRYLYKKKRTILYLGNTPLHYSADNGHVAVVKYLVDHGAHVNIKDKLGEYRVYQS